MSDTLLMALAASCLHPLLRQIEEKVTGQHQFKTRGGFLRLLIPKEGHLGDFVMHGRHETIADDDSGHDTPRFLEDYRIGTPGAGIFDRCFEHIPHRRGPEPELADEFVRLRGVWPGSSSAWPPTCPTPPSESGVVNASLRAIFAAWRL